MDLLYRDAVIQAELDAASNDNVVIYGIARLSQEITPPFKKALDVLPYSANYVVRGFVFASSDKDEYEFLASRSRVLDSEDLERYAIMGMEPLDHFKSLAGA